MDFPTAYAVGFILAPLRGFNAGRKFQQIRVAIVEDECFFRDSPPDPLETRNQKLETPFVIIIVMGVVGSGKTTIGSLLAQQLAWEFVDADSFHPRSNIEKMSRGIPLTDVDRLPWLQSIHDAMVRWRAEHKNVVLACSALKHSYRKMLRIGPEVKFIYLKAESHIIEQRLQSRHGHFATAELLASQLADLEEPRDAIAVNIDPPPEDIVAVIRRRLGL